MRSKDESKGTHAVQELTPTEKKAAIIKGFAEILDKHCQTDIQVWELLNAINEISDILTDLPYELDPGFLFSQQTMRSDLLGGRKSYNIELFDKISDIAHSTFVVACQNKDSIYLMQDMESELRVLMGYED